MEVKKTQKWNKRPTKGTSWSKFSRNRVNFKKTYKTHPKKYPTAYKKDDSLDGVYEVDFSTGITTYYTPEQFKVREKEMIERDKKNHYILALEKTWNEK